MQDEEAQLIQRAAQRDVAAWSALYERYYDDLFAYAYSRLGAREDAEDVTSQVFVEALRNIERFARHGQGNGVRAHPFLSWLLGFARKLVADRLRQAARARRAGAVLDPAIEAGDTEPVLDRLDLLDALKHLTQEQQDAIILRYFLGKSTAEIASLMGRKENAIFALQFRAVRSLRRHLIDDGGSPLFRPEAGS